MNDSCDPFGTPYVTQTKEEKKEYSFFDLEDLDERESTLNSVLREVKQEKEKAIKQLKNNIEKYVEASAEISYNKNGIWKIIVKSFDFYKLEQLKNDFDIENIRVECGRAKTDGKYKQRIIIKLEI